MLLTDVQVLSFKRGRKTTRYGVRIASSVYTPISYFLVDGAFFPVSVVCCLRFSVFVLVQRAVCRVVK